MSSLLSDHPRYTWHLLAGVWAQMEFHDVPTVVADLRLRQLPFSVPLNEWCKEQYVAEFARHFQIAQALPTPQLAAELVGYSCDELTCAQLVMAARKHKQP
jgi:hypothetical protein